MHKYKPFTWENALHLNWTETETMQGISISSSHVISINQQAIIISNLTVNVLNNEYFFLNFFLKLDVDRELVLFCLGCDWQIERFPRWLFVFDLLIQTTHPNVYFCFPQNIFSVQQVHHFFFGRTRWNRSTLWHSFRQESHVRLFATHSHWFIGDGLKSNGKNHIDISRITHWENQWKSVRESIILSLCMSSHCNQNCMTLNRFVWLGMAWN